MNRVQNGDIINCTATICEMGFYIDDRSHDNRIFMNNFSINRESGLHIANNCFNNTISNNTAFFNSCGILLENCYSQYVSNNSVMHNSYYGLHVWGANNNHIKQNNASHNNITGIRVSSGRSGNNVVEMNIADENGYAGIEVLSCASNTIVNNTVSDNPYGLLIANSEFSYLKSNTIQNNSIGIHLQGGSQNRIFDNIINNSELGVLLYSSSSNYFGENSITNSTGMSGNSIFSSYETDLDVYQNDYDWINYTSFEELLATGDGGAPLFTRSVNLVDTILFEVNITGQSSAPDLDLGIFLDGKGGNPVDGITQTGEFVAFCADFDADEGICLICPEDGTYLIRAFGYSVTENPGQFDLEIEMVNATSTGIYMMNSTHNKVINNNISYNTHGLNLTMGSGENMLYHNNIAGNAVQAIDDGLNFWNASYPIGGNYWSDYSGADAFSGPNQDVVGSDGIGDVPYTGILSTGNDDKYPLMEFTDGVYVDTTAPTSFPYIEISMIYPEFDWGCCVISCSFDDDYSGVTAVTLWYRHSLDNMTWGGWLEYETEYFANWLFDPVWLLPIGEGYYEYYTIATDGSGNIETKPQAAEIYWLFDITAPQTEVLQPINYWNIPEMDFEINVADNTNSTANVEVFYRFSENNATWSSWTQVENITAEPWNFTFGFPAGQGIYQFYSRANDTSGNLENSTAAAQAEIGYDVSYPLLADSSPSFGTTGDPYTFIVVATDNVAIIGAHTLYRFDSGSEVNATMVEGVNNSYEFCISIPTGNLDVLHYRIVVDDSAANWNSTGTKNVIVLDNDGPIANAGSNQTIDIDANVTFNGSASTDNIGIVNFTWTFNNGISNISLYGPTQNHTFAASGNFTVNLTVRDAAGNVGTDTMLVSVVEPTPIIDIVPPTANPGIDRSIVAGTTLTFSGSASTDNVGVINYTWSFSHNGTAIVLYGPSPAFTFWEVGNHTVTLNATDSAGNWDTDSMNVEVTPKPAEVEEPGFNMWLIVIAIVTMVAVMLGLWLVKGKKPKEPKLAELPADGTIPPAP